MPGLYSTASFGVMTGVYVITGLVLSATCGEMAFAGSCRSGNLTGLRCVAKACFH